MYNIPAVPISRVTYDFSRYEGHVGVRFITQQNIHLRKGPFIPYNTSKKCRDYVYGITKYTGTWLNV